MDFLIFVSLRLKLTGLLKLRDFSMLSSPDSLRVTDKEFVAEISKYDPCIRLQNCLIQDVIVILWLVGWFGFNGPLRQYFSLYRAIVILCYLTQVTSGQSQ